jgi:hypothetical protein
MYQQQPPVYRQQPDPSYGGPESSIGAIQDPTPGPQQPTYDSPDPSYTGPESSYGGGPDSSYRAEVPEYPEDGSDEYNEAYYGPSQSEEVCLSETAMAECRFAGPSEDEGSAYSIQYT